MSSQHEIAKTQDPQPPQVRHVDDAGWQVLLRSTGHWHTCRREQDAYFIASGLRTVDAVTRGETGGIEVAEELDAVAAVAARVLGQGPAEQIMHAADFARNKIKS